MAAKPISPFLQKLYELTNEFTPQDECLSWSEDGLQFWVSNIEVFSRDVLPGFYKHNNYASFVRQLNIYGFRRTSEHQPSHDPRAPVVEVFRHPMFIRGRKDLLQHIHRKSSVAAVAATHGKKIKVEDLSEEDSQSMAENMIAFVPHPEHALQQEVLRLRERTAMLESQVALLHEQNQQLYTQQVRQSDTVNALITMLGSLGIQPSAESLTFSPDPQRHEQQAFVALQQVPSQPSIDAFVDDVLDLSSPQSTELDGMLAERRRDMDIMNLDLATGNQSLLFL